MHETFSTEYNDDFLFFKYYHGEFKIYIYVQIKRTVRMYKNINKRTSNVKK